MSDGHDVEEGELSSQSQVEMPIVLKKLQKVVDAALDRLLTPFFTKVDEALFDRADDAKNLQEQRIFLDAMRMLRQSSQRLQPKISQKYLSCFDALLTNDLSLMLSQNHNLDGSLSIMEDEVLEDMIALDNFATAIVATCGESLQYLSKRLEYLLGQPIREEENPFIPVMLAENFALELSALQLDFEAKALILKLFEAYFAKNWPQVTSECNQFLKERGVRPDLEQQKKSIVKEKSGLERQPPSQQNESVSSNERAGTERNGQQGRVVDELCRLLGSNNIGDTQSSDYLAVTSVVQAITGGAGKVVSQEVADKGLERVLTDLMAANNQQFDQIHPRDKTVIKALDGAFEHIGQQNLAPRDMPDMVAKLQLPIAAMVLNDPQFLDKQNHPGRRLVNEVFKACSTFLDGADSDKDPLRKEVDDVISQLTEMELSPKELTRLLSRFIDFIEKDKRRMSVREQRLLEEEEAIAKVSVTHSFVHDQLAPLLIGHSVPGFFLKFCEDAWSKVMFLSILREGDESRSWRDRLNEFVQIKDMLAAPGAESSGDFEALLKGIQEQLEEISLDPAAIKRWATIFRDFWQYGQLSNPSPKNTTFELHEVKELILRLPGVVLVEESDDSELDLRALESVDTLRKGVWVEFKATETSDSVRCKLAGVIKPSSSYVFTNRKGLKVTEESRRRLASKIKKGNVVVLDNNRLFDQAFDDTLARLKRSARAGGVSDSGMPAQDEPND